MSKFDRTVEAENLSLAWLEAVTRMHTAREEKAVHLVLRIADPTAEVLKIREMAQQLITDQNEAHPGRPPKYDILSTRNTMFPATWASRHTEPAELAAYYCERYPRLRQHPHNRFGTYFGRIVAYPRGEDKHASATHSDQLSNLVHKIRSELSGQGGAKSSRYELNIFSEQHDTNTMSFPCMSHLSFHLHEGRLHQQAVYRNEYLVGRAYGNYLGLAQLQQYIAIACGIGVGEFIVSVGHVELDANRGEIRSMLNRYT